MKKNFLSLVATVILITVLLYVGNRFSYFELTIWYKLLICLVIIVLVALVGLNIYFIVKFKNIKRNYSNHEEVVELLNESKNRYNALFVSAGDAAFIYENNVITDCNERAEKLLKTAKENIIGLSPWEISPEIQPDGINSRAKALEIIAKCTLEPIIEFEWQHVDFEGNLIDVEITLSVFDSEKKSFLVVFRDITDKKRVHKLLIENEEKFHKAFTLSPYSIVISEFNTGKIVDANEGFLTLTGYSLSEVLGKTGRDLSIWENHEEKFQKIQEALIKNKSLKQFNSLIYTKNRDIRNLVLNLQLIYLNDKPYTITIANDVTEERKAQDLLSRSQKHYYELFNANTDAILVLTNDRHVLDCNKAFEKLFGYTLLEVKGLSLANFYADANFYNELIKKPIESLINRNKSYVEFRKKDGTVFIGELYRYAFSPNERGEISLVGIIKDVTRKLKLEKEINKLNIAVHQSASSIVITDTSGNIEFVNKKFTEITGYKFHEVLNKKPKILNSGKHTTDFYKELWDTILAGNVWQGKMHNKRKNGELYWEENTISPVYDNNKALINFIAIKQDISDKINRDQKVLNAILDTEAKERKRFAENLHDDLGPYLSGIKLYLKELAYEDLLPNKRQELLNELFHLVGEAIGITKSLSQQLMPSVLVDYGLKKAIQSFCDKIMNLNKISIIFKTSIDNSIDGTLDLVLYRIVNELINNTIKHANAKNIKIEINIIENILYFLYHDDGVGFDIQKAKENSKGLGIHNIISRMNSIKAKYKFRSTPNKGMGLVFNIMLDELL